MSYVALGGTTSGVTATGLAAEALRAINEPKVSSTLGPQAKASAIAFTSALDGALGKPLASLPEAALRTISDAVGDAASTAMGALADGIPFIGQAIGIVSLVWEAGGSRKKEGEVEFCKDLMRELAPKASQASGMAAADLFAPYIGATKGNGGKGQSSYVALQLGKMMSYGDFSETDKYGTGAYAELEYNMLAKAAPKWFAPTAAAYGYTNIVTQTSLGVPPARRRIFHKLAKAIAAQWRPPGTELYGLRELPGLAGQPPFPAFKNSDGGNALFAIYMDLLVQEFRAKHISEEFLAYLDTHNVDFGLQLIGGKATATKVPTIRSVGIPCTSSTWAVAAEGINKLLPTYDTPSDDAAIRAAIKAYKTQALLSQPNVVKAMSFVSAPKAAATAPKPAAKKPAATTAARPPYALALLGAGAFVATLLALRKLAPPKKRVA